MNKRIGILMGGMSRERDISLRSGRAVEKALRGEGVDVVAIDVDGEIEKRLKEERIEVAFIALHGVYGEDGTIQSLLELLRIPYTGSGILASAMAMDKVLAKELFRRSAIPTPLYHILHRQFFPGDTAMEGLKFPLVVKPSRQGSTIGVSIVKEEGEMTRALEEAFECDDKILLESYIEGTEVTVSILGNEKLEILPLIEMVPRKGFYDYEAKYSSGMCEHIIPPRLPTGQIEAAGKAALRAHQVLGCRGLSRTEVKLDKGGNPFILDVNTIPGMTEVSLYPEAARAAGIEFGKLCLRLIELALEGYSLC